MRIKDFHDESTQTEGRISQFRHLSFVSICLLIFVLSNEFNFFLFFLRSNEFNFLYSCLVQWDDVLDIH